MKSINVSEPVWQEIAARGKFGESEDDVLRRVFGISRNSEASGPSRQANERSDAGKRRKLLATDRMSAHISDTELQVSFASGPSATWVLPEKTNKAGVRLVRDKATSFAAKHGATQGQVNAVKKALTDAGYFVSK